MLRPLLSLLFVSVAALPAQVHEYIGGTTTSAGGTDRGIGSLFRVDTSVLLTEFAMVLNVPAIDTVTFFLYRHNSRTGDATLEWTQQLWTTGFGSQAWYSPGPIAIPLVAGNYYVLGARWTTNTQFYYTTVPQPPLSFGAWQRGHTFLGALPPTISLTGSDNTCYYQHISTTPMSAVVNTGAGCSPTAPLPRLVADDFFRVQWMTTLELVAVQPTSSALFGVANNGALPVPIPLFGCHLWLDVTGPVFTFAGLTSATGYANLAIVVPYNTALSGQTFTVQGLVFGATSTDFSNAV